MLTKMRQSRGIIETKEDRERDKQRKGRADQFEDMRKERHWSEKKRSEMTERDWRIFREDFNIAYKVCTASIHVTIARHKSRLISRRSMRFLQTDNGTPAMGALKQL